MDLWLRTPKLSPTPTSYRRLVWSTYISFSVQRLSQFMQCPAADHFAAANRVIGYVKVMDCLRENLQDTSPPFPHSIREQPIQTPSYISLLRKNAS
jgi:hypothetical protein